MNFWVKDCLRFLEWLVLGILVSWFLFFCWSLVYFLCRYIIFGFVIFLFFVYFIFLYVLVWVCCYFLLLSCCKCFGVCLCFVSFTFFWYRKVVFFLLLCRDVELYLLLFLFISLFFFLMCFLEGFCISFAMVYFFPVCLFCLIVFLDV